MMVVMSSFSVVANGACNGWVAMTISEERKTYVWNGSRALLFDVAL